MHGGKAAGIFDEGKKVSKDDKRFYVPAMYLALNKNRFLDHDFLTDTSRILPKTDICR